MAASELSPENAVTARLYDLLNQARAIKRSTTIDPPLQVSALVDGDKPLVDFPEIGEEYRNSLIEGAAKTIFYTSVGSTDIEDESFVTVWNLLDILQYCGDRNLCSPQLVLLLLEELLDSLSIEKCQIALGFLESRREVLIAARSQSKDLVILRLCNELLRRLSRAEDPVFCGRVYIFLFRSFPLGDKSSVNLRGKFHTENVTTFEEFLATSVPAEDEMQVDTDVATSGAKDDIPTENGRQVDASNSESAVKSRVSATHSDVKPSDDVKMGKEGKPTMAVDDLYPVFWSLQQLFSNPPQLFEEQKFQEFQRGLEATLAKFKEVPKVIQAGDSARKAGTQSGPNGTNDQFASAFNPKYLTSRDLFKLELSDLAFQRHILVQALIMIDFLLTLTEEAKGKPYYQDAQKSMQYPFTLREQEAEWALGIKRSIANYLQYDGPDGKVYYRMVDTVLSRDKNWVRWKMENCHSFTRDRVPARNFVESKDGAKKAVVSRKVPKPFRSSIDMDFLSNTEPEKGLRQLKHHERFEKPSLEDYAKRASSIEEELLASRSDEDKRELKEKLRSVTWREHRLGCKEKLGLYDKPASAEEKRLKGSEASTGGDSTPTDPVDKGAGPQQEHPSVEADQQDQGIAGAVAE